MKHWTKQALMPVIRDYYEPFYSHSGAELFHAIDWQKHCHISLLLASRS